MARIGRVVSGVWLLFVYILAMSFVSLCGLLGWMVGCLPVLQALVQVKFIGFRPAFGWILVVSCDCYVDSVGAAHVMKECRYNLMKLHRMLAALVNSDCLTDLSHPLKCQHIVAMVESRL